MQVKQWIVRVQWPADLRSTEWRVDAPTRLLAIMNLRNEGEFAPIVSAAVARKPIAASGVWRRG